MDDFVTSVRALAKQKGVTLSRLRFDAYDPAVKGTNPNTTASVLAGRRPVTPAVVEAFARVLGVEATSFPDYELAKARALLDPAEVGLDEAMRNLDAVRDAMRTAARSQTPHATAPPASSGKSKRAGPRAPRKAAGG